MTLLTAAAPHLAQFLSSFGLAVVTFVPVITVIITIHELGHFLTARAFNVAIDRFSIGFGRALLSWRDKGGVEWRVGWLPIGGYVRFAGDENVASVPDQKGLEEMRAEIRRREGPGAEGKYLHFKPLWQRALVVVAGPAANFVLAFVIFSFFFGVFGQRLTSTRVDEVVPGGAASVAGFRSGDVILGADGRTLSSFEDLQDYVPYRAGVPIDFVVARGGSTLHLHAIPKPVEEKSPFGGRQAVGLLGVTARGGFIKHYGPLGAIEMGAAKTWQTTSTTAYILSRVVTGQIAFSQLHGMVGIAHASGDITRQAVAEARQAGVSVVEATSEFLLKPVALLSVSVGFLNLLPIPILDGGHLLFYAYEGIARRPPRASVQAAGYRVGLALLVGLMLFATFNDLQRLRVFQFFGSLFS